MTKVTYIGAAGPGKETLECGYFVGETLHEDRIEVSIEMVYTG
jgi:hypothetical protein